MAIRMIINRLGPFVALAAILALPGGAGARQPAASEMERIQELAAQMVVDADEAYVEAVQGATGGETEEEGPLSALYNLREGASHFSRQIEISLESPGETVAAFQLLNAAFIDARGLFDRLGAYKEYRELFDTIEDTMGNLRYYYVAAEEHVNYPDYSIYPYYPGLPRFVHVYTAHNHYHYRHAYYWHRHPGYKKHFPHRAHYRPGYGRYKHHFKEYAGHSWHKAHDKHVIHKKKVVHKPAQKAKPIPKPRPKQKPKRRG